jgi:hypothetical protein
MRYGRWLDICRLKTISSSIDSIKTDEIAQLFAVNENCLPTSLIVMYQVYNENELKSMSTICHIYTDCQMSKI